MLINVLLDGWGFADVEAGIKAIPDWMEASGWKGQGIDLEKWVISGHSNGGMEFSLCATLVKLLISN